LIFPPSLNWCARDAVFFPAVTDKRPFPIQFSFFPLAQQGRIYPHILFESGLCARTQTQTRWAGLGQSFFYFTEKKKIKRKKNLRRREGARIFPFAFLFGSSVLLFFHIVLHSIIEKEEKIIDIKRPLRRNEGESLFFSDQATRDLREEKTLAEGRE
jgi:hypothetical protein